jgi:hypothetical protein
MQNVYASVSLEKELKTIISQDTKMCNQKKAKKISFFPLFVKVF